MKLRIKGNSLRLRLTRSEVASFGKAGALEERTEFPGGEALVTRLVCGERFSASLRDGVVEVQVPSEQAQRWVGSQEVGMSHQGDLRLLIEKDFACLTPRENEDESDNYPHPGLHC